jgi:hypothetical protein
VDKYCDLKLDAEYKALSQKLIEKMSKKRPPMFLAGKIEVWAAAVVYALGQNNFLFDKSFQPYVAGMEICEYFGASKTTVAAKAKSISEAFKLNLFFGSDEFLTQRMKQNNPLNFLQMENDFIVPKSNAKTTEDNGLEELEFTIPTSKSFKKVYQFKIVLKGTKPVVWRRIVVPESYTFFDLHVAIQNAMGWAGGHLHNFTVGADPRSWVVIDCVAGAEDILEKPDYFETEVGITQFFKKEKDECAYTYDFGDNWQHQIVLEKITDKAPGQKYPQCLDGAMACPPDDCGSIPGYYDCINAVKNKDNSEGLLDWLGEGWNPDEFDANAVVFESPREYFEMTMG